MFISILLQIRLINAALTTFASGSSASASDLINAGDALQPAFHAKPLLLSTLLNHALKSCCRVGHSPVNHTWNQNLTGQWALQKHSPVSSQETPPPWLPWRRIFSLCLFHIRGGNPYTQQIKLSEKQFARPGTVGNQGWSALSLDSYPAAKT